MVSGRLVAVIVVGVSTLTACANQQVGVLTQFPCPGNGAICEVGVTVDLVGSTCEPRLLDNSQKTLVMPAREHNIVIRWVLDRRSQASYEFQDDGFELKSDPMTQFPAFGAIMGGKAYQVVNRNKDRKSYAYNLLVHKKGSTQVCKLDPFINNVN